jgi:hypothetical protein
MCSPCICQSGRGGLKKILLMFLSFVFLFGSTSAFAQVPVMRGLPLSSESKSIFQKKGFSGGWGHEWSSDKKSGGKQSINKGKAPSGSSFKKVTPEEMTLKKKALSGTNIVEDLCPKSQRLAVKQAKMDAAAFAKKTPWGTWSLFMQKFRRSYADCSPFIKRAYLASARDILQPKPRAMFQR